MDYRSGAVKCLRGWTAALGSIAIFTTIVACDGATLYAPQIRRPAEIIKTAGDNQQASPGARLDPVGVVVQDSVGRAISGILVTFSVTRGDGFVGTAPVGIPDTGSAVTPTHQPVSQMTNAKGEATARWWNGKSGENTLLVTTEMLGATAQTVFHATSSPTGYAGGLFSLTSRGTALTLHERTSGETYQCVVTSGSLTLSPDGSFEDKRHFDCKLLFGDVGGFDVNETGFYSVSGSTINLHYLDSGDAVGWFDPRDVTAVLNESSIDVNVLGVALRYEKVD